MDHLYLQLVTFQRSAAFHIYLKEEREIREIKHRYVGPVAFVGRPQSGKKYLGVRLEMRDASDISFLTQAITDDRLTVSLEQTEESETCLVIYFITVREYLGGPPEGFCQRVRDYSVIVFCFDVNNLSSFLGAVDLLGKTREVLRQDTPSCMLVGNKIDARVAGGVISPGVGDRAASEKQASYYECSALRNIGTQEFLQGLLEQMRP